MLEERGFESLWVPEHSHIPVTRSTMFPGGGELPRPYYDIMDPFLALTAAAVATTKLKVGTGVCLINQRDPIQTAKTVASIDQLSDGRFLFGVGNGWNREEMEHHGTVFETRHKLSRERIEAMQAIWTQDTAEYHGEFVNFAPMQTVAEAGAAAASADHRRRRLAVRRAARGALRQWLDPPRRPAAIRRRDEFPAAVPRNGARGGARPRRSANHHLPRAGQQERLRHYRGSGRRTHGDQPAGGEGRTRSCRSSTAGRR